MKFLVTSSRMPFALDEIRKLGKQGHDVVASDTFESAPGSHSKYAESRKVTASPRYETRRFIADVAQIIREERIDFVLPAFEEVFYLAAHRAELGGLAHFFMPSLDTLRRLHDKTATIELAHELSVAVPRTLLAHSHDELRAATSEIDVYFARPAYSRGGVELLTNHGPLDGATQMAECHPSADNPWLVQEYVEGVDICSFSIVHGGRIAAHSTYIHPREIEHAGGIVFESIVDPSTLAVAMRIAEHTRYHGQFSLDFKRTDRGLVLIECNPRPTAGVLVMSPAMFADAILDRRPKQLVVAQAGVKRKYSVALIRDMVLHWSEAPRDIQALLSGGSEVYAEKGDLLPGLYQLLSYGHVRQYRKMLGMGEHKATDLMAAYFHDICWNGEPIE